MFVETKTVAALVPELILILVASGLFVGSAFCRCRQAWLVVSLLGLAGAAGVLLVGAASVTETGPLVTGPLRIDELAQSFRFLALVTGAVTLLVLTKQATEGLAGEIFGLVLLVTAGIMVASMSNELVTLFLGLELISIPTYILLFLGRKGKSGSESTMKYFFLSILSSALMLYGFSFLYGIGGTTIIDGTSQFPGIRQAVEGMNSPAANTNLLGFVPFAVVLITAGFAFKLTAVPFHFYAPDVYQGTSNANAGLLAVAPKIAGVVGLVRILLIALPAAAPLTSETAPVASITLQTTWQLLLVLSIITMTIGNICALWQNNLRRMMAYSSIAHAGYLLIGLSAAAVGDSSYSGGVAAMVFYLIVYSLASLGTFAALAALGAPGKEVSTLDDVAGAAKTHPVLAGVIAIGMFSLAGLPPLAGFWGKLSLFLGAVSLAMKTDGTSAAVSYWFAVLAIAGVVNAAIAAAYYLRVIAAMYFQPAKVDLPASNGWGPKIAAVACGIAVLVTAYPRPLLQLGQRAEEQLPKVVRHDPAVKQPVAFHDVPRQ